jgi:hypothetical protein
MVDYPCSVAKEMKTLLPAFLLVAVAVGFIATEGDPIGTRVVMYAGSILLLIFGVGLSFTVKGHVLRHVAIYAVAIAVLLVIAWTQFPFRLAFSLSESALGEIASQIRAGERVSLPKRAGLFTVRAAGQKDDGSIYLWTDPDPAGPAGFVFHYTGGGYNLWSKLRLKEDWYFISED